MRLPFKLRLTCTSMTLLNARAFLAATMAVGLSAVATASPRQAAQSGMPPSGLPIVYSGSPQDGVGDIFPPHWGVITLPECSPGDDTGVSAGCGIFGSEIAGGGGGGAGGRPKKTDGPFSPGDDVKKGGGGDPSDLEPLGSMVLGKSTILYNTGQAILEETDLVLPGRDHATTLVIGRRHLSKMIYTDSAFGETWAFTLDQRVDVESGSGQPSGPDLMYFYGNGRVDTFIEEDPVAHTFLGADGRFGIADWDGVLGTADIPGSLVLRRSSGVKVTYEIIAGMGRMTEILSPNLNKLQFVYDGCGRIDHIVDSYGRDVDFLYGDPNDAKLVTTIVDYDLREVSYHYDAQGVLISVDAPEVASTGVIGGGGNDFVDGANGLKKTSYVYDAVHTRQLAGVIRPNEDPNSSPQGSGATSLSWVYDVDGLVISHTVGNQSIPAELAAGGTITLQYFNAGSPIGELPDENTLVAPPGALPPGALPPAFDYQDSATSGVMVTDARGHAVYMEFNLEGQLLHEWVYGGLRSNAPSSAYHRSFKYNEFGKMISATNAMNSTLFITYPDPNGASPHTALGKQLEVYRVPDTARGGEQLEIRSKVVFEPIFNKPFKVIAPRGFEPGASEADFTTTFYLDYMENLPAAAIAYYKDLGYASAVDLLAHLTSMELGITDLGGDVNGDGVTNQMCGNVIKVVAPPVTLPSQAAPVISDLSQDAIELFRYNDVGLMTHHVDAEENIHEYSYYPENDPDGDTLFPIAGASTDDEYGFLKEVRVDTFDAGSGSTRNSGAITGAAALVTQFEYKTQATTGFIGNSRGVPTAVIDPRGTKSLYLVNELDQVVQVVRAESGTLPAFGYTTTFIRDRNDNVTEVIVQDSGALGGPANGEITYTVEYDILDLPRTQVSDKDGVNAITKYSFDNNRNLLQVIAGATQPEETITQWTYDERNLVMSIERGEGSIDSITSNEIDWNGNITKLIDAHKTSGGAGPGDEAIVLYDGYDRPIIVVDRVGTRTARAFDAAHNVYKELITGNIEVSQGNDLPSEELSNIDFTYDPRNRLQRVDRELFVLGGLAALESEGGALGGAGSVSSVMVHDRMSRTVARIDANSSLTEYQYDGVGRIAKALDAEGNEVAVTYDGNSNPTIVNVKEISNTGSFATTPLEESYLVSREFDSLNRMTKFIEPNGQETAFSYDSRNNLTKRIDELNNEVEFRHDGMSRLLSKTTYLSSNGLGASSTNLDPTQGGGDGKVVVSQTYDDLHRVKAVTDDNSNVTTNTWDDLSRLTGVSYGDGTTKIWVYNLDSEPLAHLDQNGSLWRYATDAGGRVTKATVSFSGNTKGTKSQLRTYDGLNRVWSTFNDNLPGKDDDVTVEWLRDSLGRSFKEKLTIGVTNPITVEERRAFEGDNRITDAWFSNGRKDAWVFDGLDRPIANLLSDAATGLNGVVTYSKHYVGFGRELETEYGNGSKLNMLNNAGTSTVSGAGAGYDSNRRVVEYDWNTLGGSQITNYVSSWNGVNRRKDERRGHLFGHHDTYSFDSAYRMTGFERNSSTSMMTNIEYDGADKMTLFDDEGVNRSPQVDADPTEAGMNQYSNFDGSPRVYDDNGNFRKPNIQAGEVLTFDALNRVVKVSTSAGGPKWEYIYDADNRRVGRLDKGGSGPDETTYYAYNCNWQVCEELDSTGATKRQYAYGPGIDRPVSMRDYTGASEERYYYHSNSQGFIGALTNDSGTVVEYYEYKMLGKPTILAADKTTVRTESAYGNTYMFQGRRYDHETGLYHFRNRYYDPETGEFISIDPSGLWTHGQGNGYSAFGGDPWNRMDPFGLKSHDPDDPEMRSPQNMTETNYGGLWMGPPPRPERSPEEVARSVAEMEMQFWRCAAGALNFFRKAGDSVLGLGLSSQIGEFVRSDVDWEETNQAMDSDPLISGMGTAGTVAGTAVQISSAVTALKPFTVTAGRYATGGGGINIFKHGKRWFAVDWHRFKIVCSNGASKWVNRLHLHWGKTKGMLKKHRPWNWPGRPNGGGFRWPWE